MTREEKEDCFWTRFNGIDPDAPESYPRKFSIPPLEFKS